MKPVFETIFIEPLTLADILLAVDLCSIEISGLARVKETEEGLIVFGEPIIFYQKCSLGGTEFDTEALGLWYHEMMRSGCGREINEYRLWWHSHVFSGAYFSGTDNDQIESWNDSPAPGQRPQAGPWPQAGDLYGAHGHGAACALQCPDRHQPGGCQVGIRPLE